VLMLIRPSKARSSAERGRTKRERKGSCCCHRSKYYH